MSTSIMQFVNGTVFQRIISIFGCNKDRISEAGIGEIVTKEMDDLWAMAGRNDEDTDTDSIMEKKIARSFKSLTCRYSEEMLDSVYTWPRYVKLAVQYVEEPIEELVKYVKESNYIYLTKTLSNLTCSVCKDEDMTVKRNMEHFAEAVYKHILDDINPEDIPSFLALGRMAQSRRDYVMARRWYEEVLKTAEPFNGITALLACYDDEIRVILADSKRKGMAAFERKRKIGDLNRSQYAIYEEWCRKMEDRINSEEDVTETEKREYVSLVTGYARFERNRDNFDKAYNLLERVPGSYPEIYRVYTERAMLYQFKPYKNQYYDLEKAIVEFKKAEVEVNEDASKDKEDARSKKSRKSILMPLANAYYMSGRYCEAAAVCDNILKIDANEQRAIELKDKISLLA